MKGEKSIQKSSESDEMASKPSWLDDEDNQEAVAGAAAKVAQNPVAQKAASKIANDPGVQSAVKSAAKDAAKEAIFGASSKPAEETPSNYPSWTSDTPSATATPVATPVKDIESGRASTTSTSEESKEFTMDAELLLNMQRWHLALRICYMIAAILLAASGVYALMQVYPPIETVFFAIYVIFFATVLCCFEVAIDAVAKMIAINFGFLYTTPGRLVFILFVGFMAFSYSLFGQIAMGILYAVFLFHLFVKCKFPRLEEYLRKKHYYTRN